MNFSVFLSPQAEQGSKLPVVRYASGLTSNHAKVTEKGGYHIACAELGLIFEARGHGQRSTYAANRY